MNQRIKKIYIRTNHFENFTIFLHFQDPNKFLISHYLYPFIKTYINARLTRTLLHFIPANLNIYTIQIDQ